MTSRDRLLCAFGGGKPDRLPVYVRGVNVLDPAWIDTKHPSFRPLADYVSRHCDLLAHANPRVHGGARFLSADVSALAAGQRVVSDDGQRRVVEDYLVTPKGEITHRTTLVKDQPGLASKYWIEDEDDVDKVLSIPYAPPEIDCSPIPARQQDVGDRALVIAATSSPIFQVYMLLGSERLCLWSIDKRDVVRRLLGVVTDRWRYQMEAMLAQGCGPIIGSIGEEVITPPLHPPADFQEFIVDVQKPVYDRFRAKGVLIHTHCHGNLQHVLGLFHHMGVTSLHPVETPPMGDITLDEFRRQVGTDICIKGNVQIGDLFSQTPDQIRAFCRHTIDVAGRDGALILAPSASPYLHELTPQVFANYKAMIDAALEFGREV